jgi:uncharacterized protein (UPF0371 family)
MEPITMMMVGSALAKGATSIGGSIFGQNQDEAQVRAANEEAMRQYRYQLQIRDKQEKDKDQLYATKLGQYDLGMKAADRAASRAYGIEQYNQSQRLKQAAVQNLSISRALAASGGKAAASGKTGRSAQRIDQNIIADFVRNRNMITQNLLTAEETRQYRELGIQDTLQSRRNQLFSDVAIAPTRSMVPLAPTQQSAPSRAGMYLDIASAGIDTAMSVAGALPKNPLNNNVPKPNPKT